MNEKVTNNVKKESYTDEEINELAEWLDDLTLKQAFFLKESFQAYLDYNAKSHGQEFMH